jgi:lipoprotein-anchoring transpeptidase ErfK/SrfK
MRARRRILIAGCAAVAVGAATVASQTGTAVTPDTTTVAAPPDSATRDPIRGPIRLVADVSDRKLHIYDGEEIARSYTVAVGTAKYPTPRGSFRIRKVVWNPPWVPPKSPWAKKETPKAPGQKGNPMKVVKIFFREPDFYIHGTAQVESLGDAASHGCIRMEPSEAAEVARYVMEHGGQPQEESWFKRVISLRWNTRTVHLSRPVSITITD